MSDAKPMSDEELADFRAYVVANPRTHGETGPALRMFALYDQTVREREAAKASLRELQMGFAAMLTDCDMFKSERDALAAEAALKQQEPKDDSC